MAEATTQSTEEKKPKLSRGEKLFNWLVYGGIAGVATFIATIPAGYWAKYGGGAKFFKSFGKGLEKLGVSARSAEDAAMTTGLMQGGNLMILPVKWAEDNKVELIKKIDHVLGDKTDVDALEKEDKQSWGSIIKARLAAWAAVFSGFKLAGMTIGNEKFAAFEESFAKHIVCKPFGKATHIAGEETKMFRIGKIAALDVFATAAASILLYAGSRFFAHHKKNNPAPAPEATENCTGCALKQPEEQVPAKIVQDIIRNKKPDSGYVSAMANRPAPTAHISA